jgi:hypothetical protein
VSEGVSPKKIEISGLLQFLQIRDVLIGLFETFPRTNLSSMAALNFVSNTVQPRIVHEDEDKRKDNPLFCVIIYGCNEEHNN